MFVMILFTCLLTGTDCRPHVEVEGLTMAECQVRVVPTSTAYMVNNPDRRVMRIICDHEDNVETYLGQEV